MGITTTRIALVTSALLLGACVRNLNVNAPVPLRDASAVSSGKRAQAAVMVLPPHGSERGEASELASLERALLKRGVRVISSGMTGRVVVEETEGGRNTQGASGLSDLERALVLARKSNADALLQVGQIQWVESSRYFIPVGSGGDLDETKAREQFLAADPQRRFAVTSPSLSFIGKLIDVETGEVVASIDLSRSVGDASVPATYKTTDREFKVDSSVVRQGLVNELMNRLAEIVISGEARSKEPPSAPAAAPAAPSPPPAASSSSAPPAKKKR